MSHRVRNIALLILFGGWTGLAGSAHAGAKDFVVYAAGMGGDAETARPYLEKFFRELEPQFKWPAGSAAGAYFDDAKGAEKYIKEHHPGYGMLTASLFLDLSCKKEVEPLARVRFVSRPAGPPKYHVVVKGDTIKDLKDLEGKRLVSNHLQDVAFVSRIVFDRKLDAAKYFTLKPVTSPVKPFKAIDRGEADAALVDDAQLAGMKALPFAKELHVVYSSPPGPMPEFVAFTRETRPAEREAMRKVVLDLCKSPAGAEVCKALQIAGFEPVDAHADHAAIQSYCKP